MAKTLGHSWNELSEEVMHQMGVRLRHERERAGFTQREVATLCGVSGSSVSNWETGRNGLNLASLYNLVKTLGYSADYILIGRTPHQVVRQDLADKLATLSDTQRRALVEALEAATSSRHRN